MPRCQMHPNLPMICQVKDGARFFLPYNMIGPTSWEETLENLPRVGQHAPRQSGLSDCRVVKRGKISQ